MKKIALIVVICLCFYRLIETSDIYRSEEAVQRDMSQYAPDIDVAVALPVLTAFEEDVRLEGAARFDEAVWLEGAARLEEAVWLEGAARLEETGVTTNVGEEVPFGVCPIPEEDSVPGDLPDSFPGSLQGYIPGNDKDAIPAEEHPAPVSDRVINGFLSEMRENVNDDVRGWITIPDTRIDYPFAIAGDNEFYLRRDIYGKNAQAGTLFMDYRNRADFSDVNTIIYGHNMKNHSMFGDLKRFSDPQFFDEVTYGYLWIETKTYILYFFAYLVVSSDDMRLYTNMPEPDGFIEYVKENSRNYRVPQGSGKFVSLSTCAYDFDGARIVLLAELAEVTPG